MVLVHLLYHKKFNLILSNCNLKYFHMASLETIINLYYFYGQGNADARIPKILLSEKEL